LVVEQMTFIIADACVNFRTIDEAKQLIRACASAGVDAVKFQAYRKGHPAPGHPRAAEIDAIVMTPEMARELWQCCQENGAEFMCTAMYPDAVAWLAPMLKRFKVRYADRLRIEMFEAIAKFRMDKEAIISVDKPPIDRRFPVKYLYVVPEYPPNTLPEIDFSQYDGFSSHYPDWHVPAMIAKDYDLEYLEVHVMLDEYAGGWDPIDRAVSLSITDLRKLVEVVKG
jgi:sialic acid synthase SpsE